MKSIFKKAGVEITKENKKEIDKLVHSIVGVDYKNCSATWKAVKVNLADNESSFVDAIKKNLSSHSI
jgi:hypothetical protein